MADALPPPPDDSDRHDEESSNEVAMIDRAFIFPAAKGTAMQLLVSKSRAAYDTYIILEEVEDEVRNTDFKMSKNSKCRKMDLSSSQEIYRFESV